MIREIKLSQVRDGESFFMHWHSAALNNLNHATGWKIVTRHKDGRIKVIDERSGEFKISFPASKKVYVSRK